MNSAHTAALEKCNADLEFQWSMPLDAGLTRPTAVADGDVYLSGALNGIRSDKFEDGSTPRPNEVWRFIARYDLAGDRVWFKLFGIDGAQSPASTWSSWLGVAKDGNLTYISTASLGDPGKVIRFRAADGSAY